MKHKFLPPPAAFLSRLSLGIPDMKHKFLPPPAEFLSRLSWSIPDNTGQGPGSTTEPIVNYQLLMDDSDGEGKP